MAAFCRFNLMLQRALSSAILTPQATSLATKSFGAIKVQNCFSRAFAISHGSSIHRFFGTLVKCPKMADSITEGTLSCISKKIGEKVSVDETIAVIETDKTSVAVNSPVAGVLTKIFVADGATVVVDDTLFEIEAGTQEAAVGGKKEYIACKPNTEEAKSLPKRPASEVKAELAQKTNAKSNSSTAAASSMSQKASSRGEKSVPMSRIRQRIAQRLKQAQNTAASLTTVNECDMSHLMAFRSELNKTCQEKHGVKLGFVSMFLAASAKAMMEMPEINGYITEDGKNIVYKDYVDISVAVATETGLLVPVIRDCEKKTIVELEKELQELSAKARAGQIALEDMIGGTFTISNGGVFGSLLGTPILNPPQASILGLHGIKERPVVVDHEIKIRPMMYLALTYDHRLLDGRNAVIFLNKVKGKLEDPRTFLLQ